MAHGLVSTGVSFPDATTQTTASLYPLTSGIQHTVVAATTTNIDLSLGTFVRLTHGADITTLNFTNVPSGRAILVKLLRQKDNSHTIRTIAWQSNWRLNGLATSSHNRASPLGKRRSEYYPGQAPDNRYLPNSNTNATTQNQGAAGYPGFLDYDDTTNNYGIQLLQSPNAVDMLQFLTLDGGTTWRYMGIEWSANETYIDQDFFQFGWPGNDINQLVDDGYGGFSSSAIQASAIDWNGAAPVGRGHGSFMGTNIAPYERRPTTAGSGSFNIPDYGSNNAWHRYDEWRQLQLFGTYVVQYSIGQHNQFAVNNTGHLFGQGSNGHSGLGRNYTQDNVSAERHLCLTKPILSPVTQMSTGRHGCSVIVNGNQLWTWGLDTNGQRGQGFTIGAVSSPIQVTSSVGTWAIVAEGYETTYAIKSTGTLWAWGRGGEGQIGDGASVSRSSPTQIGAATNWVRVKAGHLNVAAINSSGQLYCWGQNNYGQGGNGDTTNRAAPTIVLGVQNYAQGIDSWSINNNGMIAVKTDGTLWTWGRGGEGQLGWYPEGLGQINRSSPVQVGTLTNWSKVYGHGCANYAIKTDGTLWGWGRNAQWQLCLLNTNYGGVVGMPYREETTHQKSSPIQLNSSTRWQRLFNCPDENGNQGGRYMIALANTAVPTGQTTVI
jgi:alpha-tubulin suppressor-like RCC1 family protein